MFYVDLSTNVLHVRRNVTYPKGDNRPCIGTPKTESGNRDVPIMSALLEYLHNQLFDPAFNGGN